MPITSGLATRLLLLVISYVIQSPKIDTRRLYFLQVNTLSKGVAL